MANLKPTPTASSTAVERPIQFTNDEVLAVRAGRKTQHRVPVMPQPKHTQVLEGERLALRLDPINGGFVLTYANAPLVSAMQAGHGWIAKAFGPCPFGNPGERLWVQEAYWTDRRADDVVIYDATPEYGKYRNEEAPVRATFPDDKPVPRDEARAAMLPKFWTLQPAETMPRWASRFTFEAGDEVWAERLNSITEKDVIAEGLIPVIGQFSDARVAYRFLWNLAHGKRPGCAFDDNPWVWACTSELLTIPSSNASRAR